MFFWQNSRQLGIKELSQELGRKVRTIQITQRTSELIEKLRRPKTICITNVVLMW